LPASAGIAVIFESSKIIGLYMENLESKIWDNFNNRLISIMAHDLRQPFSAIIMTAEMLKLTQKPLDQEEFNIIMEDLRHMASKSIELLDGLLYWVKSKKEGFEYTTQPLYLYDLINESNSLHIYDQQKKGITFSNAIHECQIIYAHKQMLQFINRNIFSNATKYSPANSAIKVSAVINEKWVTVAITDQGKGMTKEQLFKLFRIQQIEEHDDNTLKSAGMALSICQDMIRQMNGKLWADSIPGVGTTFYYALPMEK
jgi:K+-sensing histidine kinase KdpD